MGPMLLLGFVKALLKSPNHVAMFIILFSASQNFGGLIGSSFYSTYQQHHYQQHRQAILQSIPSTDPAVNLRFLQYQGSYRGTVIDPTLNRQQAINTLNQVVNRESTVLAYSDVMRFNSYLSALGIMWGIFVMIVAMQYLKKNPLNLARK